MRFGEAALFSVMASGVCGCVSAGPGESRFLAGLQFGESKPLCSVGVSWGLLRSQLSPLRFRLSWVCEVRGPHGLFFCVLSGVGPMVRLASRQRSSSDLVGGSRECPFSSSSVLCRGCARRRFIVGGLLTSVSFCSIMFLELGLRWLATLVCSYCVRCSYRFVALK